MPVDQRNLTTLVDDDFNDKLSRIPSGLQKDLASIMLRVELYRRYDLVKAADLLENYVNRWLRFMVSDQGKGRAEMVAAIQSEQGGILAPRVGEALRNGSTVINMNANGKPEPPVKPKEKLWAKMRNAKLG